MKSNTLAPLVAAANLKPSKFFPLPESQVIEMESRLGITFPATLFDFFVLTGADYDLLMRGGGGAPQSVTCLPAIGAVAYNLLKQYGADIDAAYLAFLEYSDQFLYVRLDEGDDPPVYSFEAELFYCGNDYLPGSSQSGLPRGVRLAAPSFSEMIAQVLGEFRIFYC